MKKSILTLLYILLSITSFAQHSNKDLVGKWEGKDSQGTEASIQFLDTNKVIIIIGGKPMPPLTYTTELPKNPTKLDVHMITPDGQMATLPGFLLIVDNDTIKWQIFPNGNPPAAYDENSPDGPVITLTKNKE